MTKKNVKLLVWVLLTLLIGFTSCEKEDLGIQNTEQTEDSGTKNLKPTNEYWDYVNLKGRVKSVTQFTYQAVDKLGKIEKGEKKSFDNFKVKYTSNGYLIKIELYKPNGSLEKKRTYKYDSKGNQIEKKMYNSDGSLDEKVIFYYNSEGKRTVSKMYSNDDFLLKTMYYRYDNKGYLTEKKESNFMEVLTNWTFKYDNKGNLIEKHNHSKFYKWTYKYDNKEGIIEQNKYSAGKLDWRYTYQYDSNGNITERDKYDADENLIEKYTHKFEYDKKENWIKKITYLDGKPSLIIEREYEYYE